jgi:sugar/nucleoside kinase (ribokinase family)
MFDFCAVGHVTRDVIRIAGRRARRQPGGAALYAAMAAARLGLRTAVVTRMRREDQGPLLSGLEAAGVMVFCRPSRRTSFFENIYPGPDPDLREQVIGPPADPFARVDLEGVSARAYLLDPRTRRGGFASFLKVAAAKQALVVLEVQGFVRLFTGPRARPGQLEREIAGFRFVNVLKAGADEAAALTGEGDAEEAVRRLAALGPSAAIVTLGSRGSLVFAEGRLHRIPAFSPRKLVDATGCGDTYLAGYVYRRLQGGGPEQCGRFAAALATLKLERYGPFTGSAGDVEALLSKARGAGV